MELLARELEAAGATIINTGIGWHEARVPTIATCGPRGAFAFATFNVREALLAKYDRAPLMCATNRINSAATCEEVLEQGADVVSMARPFLADPFFLTKAMAAKPESINTCIACNQACIGHGAGEFGISCIQRPETGREKL